MTTAFLSRNRSPGAVLRVEAILIEVVRSSSKALNFFVSVAIPLILIIKLSAVLSAFIMDNALPIISNTLDPFFTNEPSLTIALLLHLHISNIIDASSSPHTIVGSLALQVISA